MRCVSRFWDLSLTSGKRRTGDSVGGSAVALLGLLLGGLGATQCGAPSKPQPTTWNGRPGIW